MRRTNCNNCGAPLIDGKCPYCKTEWFRPGFQLGKNAYVGDTRLERHTLHSSVGRDMTGKLNVEILGHVNKVELSIIGMTDEEVQELMEAIYNVNWSK